MLLYKPLASCITFQEQVL